MTKTNMSANLFIVNGRVPEGARLVSQKGVKDDAHPIGSALIQFTETGIYAMFNAGELSSCDQAAAAAIDAGGKVEQMLADHNTTMTEVSEMYGIPYRTIQDWCAGRRKAPEYVLRLLDKCLSYDRQ